MVAFQTGKNPPFELVKMKLMEKFHWTAQEFENQPWDEVELFLDMMNIEAQFQERELNKQKHARR